jgi:hypothetical protein
MKTNEPARPLDQERVERLVKPILLAIRQNYVDGPVSRHRVYEALNALAFCAAWTIRGAGDPEALDFFSKALNMNLVDDRLNPTDADIRRRVVHRPREFSYCLRWERDKFGVVWLHVSNNCDWRQTVRLHDRSFEE